MALAMLESFDCLSLGTSPGPFLLWSLDGPLLGVFNGPCYAWELRCPFLESLSWSLLCLGGWMDFVGSFL